MGQLTPYFTKNRGKPRVDDRRMLIRGSRHKEFSWKTAACAAAMVALSPSAHGQTTDCSTIGTYTHCQTQQPYPQPQSDPSSVINQQLIDLSNGTTYRNAYQAGVMARQQREAAQAQRQATLARQQAAQDESVRARQNQRVAELKVTNCPDAKRLAAFNGRTDLVANAVRARR